MNGKKNLGAEEDNALCLMLIRDRLPEYPDRESDRAVLYAASEEIKELRQQLRNAWGVAESLEIGKYSIEDAIKELNRLKDSWFTHEC